MILRWRDSMEKDLESQIINHNIKLKNTKSRATQYSAKQSIWLDPALLSVDQFTACSFHDYEHFS